MNYLKNLFKKIYTEGPNEHFIKKLDSWTSIIFSDPFSIPIARFAARWKRIHPNHFTIMTLPVALISAYFFFEGQLIYGAIFYWLNFILDGVDGKLARLTNQLSRRGYILDYYTDRIKNIVLFLSLWYSQYYLKDYWLLGGGIICVHYGLMVFEYLFIQKFTYKTVFPRVYSYYAPLDEVFLIFFLAPLLNMVFILLPLLILLQYFSYISIYIKQKERPDTKARLREMFKL